MKKSNEELQLKELEKTVIAISNSIKKIRESGISNDSLLTLIQRNCAGCVGRSNAKPNKTIILAVIEGMETLHDYVFPEELR